MSDENNQLSSLTVFFPAYNEEDNIQETIKQADEMARTITTDYEILIINDGSADKTAENVLESQKTYPNVKLINHPTNLGYGAALMSGFKNASKEWTFFSDADLQFDLMEITELTQYSDEFDVIIGYRIKRNDPLMRLLNAKGWNLLNRLLFGLKVRDIDCAFKLFKTSALHEVIPNMASRGAMISAELLIRLQRAGHSFKEVGVNHYPRTAGSPTGAKPSVIIRAFRELAKVYHGDLGKEWVKQVVKYMIIGVANTLLDIVLYFVISRNIGFLVERKVWAKGLSYLLAAVNSFFWNKSWTFKSEIKPLSMYAPFFLVTFASIAINVSVMFVALNTLMLGEIGSLFLATSVTLVWNFLLSKFIMFQS